MNWFKQTLSSSIGKKFIMALTGLMLVGFLIVHMIGNLNIFRGPDALNGYAETLRHLGILFWGARIGLALIFIIHLRMAAQLTRENLAARPVPYGKKRNLKATYASRTMLISGLLIFAYLLYHLAHYTLKWTHPEYQELEGNVYQMVILGFSNIPISLMYMTAMVVLGFHLFHAISSAFQTLGFTHLKYHTLRQSVSVGLAFIISLGFAIVPFAVLVGFVK